MPLSLAGPTLVIAGLAASSSWPPRTHGSTGGRCARCCRGWPRPGCYGRSPHACRVAAERDAVHAAGPDPAHDRPARDRAAGRDRHHADLLRGRRRAVRDGLGFGPPVRPLRLRPRPRRQRAARSPRQRRDSPGRPERRRPSSPTPSSFAWRRRSSPSPTSPASPPSGATRWRSRSASRGHPPRPNRSFAWPASCRAPSRSRRPGSPSPGGCWASPSCS